MRDIVIFEDLDRFNDPRIFEALRSLNGILNAARQLNGRNIRFIYAVRDSVFEKLGRDEELAATDETRAELIRANRTKFFELVIPVVPFITHKNARDLMHELLTERGHQISKDLVDLAARHVADMRLIHNIANEYEVFTHRLLDVSTPVPELDAERLFAMILFKNAYMADFEAIRLGTSSLDQLYDTWRDLVSANLRRLREEIAKLRSRMNTQQAADDRATELASRLRSLIDVLAAAPGSGLMDNAVSVDGADVDDDELRTPAFWQKLLETDSSIVLTAHLSRNNSYYNSGPASQQMELSPTALQTLLGTRLDSADWVARSVTDDESAIIRNESEVAFLRRHAWRDLVERSQFKHAAHNGDAMSFRQWVEHLMPSQLAADLVINGYITSYFSLHVSAFYGQLIRPDAMTYVIRNVDHGIADPDYPLDADDVEAILRDQGRSVLSERSMYNVAILDHLLAQEPNDAAVLVKRLTEGGPEELAFIDHYLTAGSAKPGFVEHLAPHSPAIFTYFASDAPLNADERGKLLDVAIAHRNPGTCYELTDALSAFIEANYRSLPSLTDPAGHPLAKQTVQLIAETGARLPRVAGLSDAVCDELLHTRAYQISADNLERIARTSDISLDRLKAVQGDVYAYAIDHLSEYLGANQASHGTTYTIGESERFGEILNGSNDWRSPDFERLVGEASPACTLADLKEAPTLAWPALVASKRVPATAQNVAACIEWKGEVDVNLAVLLSSTTEITDWHAIGEDARNDLATAIVNSGRVLGDAQHRIRLALSLEPGTLATSLIQAEPGELIGRLISSGLLEDDEEAFAARLMVEWSTLEFAIMKSENYKVLVGPETLPTGHIAPLMRSPKIDNEVRRAIIDRLTTFDNVPRDAYQAIAECGLQDGVTLDTEAIEIVRQGGAATTSVVGLLARALERMSLEELRQILRKLGEPYSVIADKGKQRPKLDDTPENRAILQRLQSAGIVSKVSLAMWSSIRVTRRHV